MDTTTNTAYLVKIWKRCCNGHGHDVRAECTTPLCHRPPVGQHATGPTRPDYGVTELSRMIQQRHAHLYPPLGLAPNDNPRAPSMPTNRQDNSGLTHWTLPERGPCSLDRLPIQLRSSVSQCGSLRALKRFLMTPLDP